MWQIVADIIIYELLPLNETGCVQLDKSPILAGATCMVNLYAIAWVRR